MAAQLFRVLNNVSVGPAGLTSATRVVPAGVTNVGIQLVLGTSNPNWDSPSVAGAVWEWAVELQEQDGSWNLLAGNEVQYGSQIPVGWRSGARTGNVLPRLEISRPDLPGRTVRAMARCSAALFVSVDLIIGE